MYDLPSEDPEEPGLPDDHAFQPQLLREFRPPSYLSDQVFSVSDLNLYYDVRHPGWYKRPDWFGVVGIPRLYEQRDLRLSYVMWQEGVSPFVVIELLSPGTESEDLGQPVRPVEDPPTKWQVYEQILRIPYYVLFDRYTDQLQAFTLTAGYYQQLNLTESRVWIPALELGLGLWSGAYQGIERQWLRWYDAQENWVLTDAGREQQRAEQAEPLLAQERQRAKQEHQRAEQLAERLRTLGLDP